MVFEISDVSAVSHVPKIDDSRLIQLFKKYYPDVDPHQWHDFATVALQMVESHWRHVHPDPVSVPEAAAVPRHSNLNTFFMKAKLEFVKLSDHPEYIPVAAQWVEDEWCYIRNKGVVERGKIIQKIQDDFYIGLYGNRPRAMFALLDHLIDLGLPGSIRALPKAKQLMYVYVSEEVRGLGFGRQIIEKAKRLALETGSDVIVLDTLKSKLNRMYEQQGARVVCQHHLFSHPTDVLMMNVHPVARNMSTI